MSKEERYAIERYDLSMEDQIPHMAPRPTGAWVTYAQHLSMLAGVLAERPTEEIQGLPSWYTRQLDDLRAARADAERLDWLNGRLNGFTTQGGAFDPAHRNIREAIDASRAALAATPEEK